VARAYPRAVAAWARGVDLSGVVCAGWPAGESALDRGCEGNGDVPLPGQWCGVRQAAAWPHDLTPGGVHPARSLACAGTGHARRPVVWAVRAEQAGGVGGLPGAPGARAGGPTGGAGLADGLPGPWRRPSRTLGEVWSPTGVPRGDPAGEDATAAGHPLGGGGVTRGPGVGARGRREVYALTARHTRVRTLPGRPSRHETPRVRDIRPARWGAWPPATGPFRVERPIELPSARGARLGTRVVHPAVGADRAQLRGACVYGSRGRSTLIVSRRGNR
jgi:hypothetical protein